MLAHRVLVWAASLQVLAEAPALLAVPSLQVVLSLQVPRRVPTLVVLPLVVPNPVGLSVVPIKAIHPVPSSRTTAAMVASLAAPPSTTSRIFSRR